MATGAEHAREAERLLTEIRQLTRIDGVDQAYYGVSGQELVVWIPQLLAALVHACLAAAAALAEADPARKRADDPTMLLPTVPPRTGRPQ